MRRQYITHPRFQFLFALAYVRGALVSVLGGAVLLFTALYLLSIDPCLRPEQAATVSSGLKDLLFVYSAIAAMTVVFCAFLGLYLSYKMAGPIRRMEDWLVQKNAGESVPALRLRPGDEWIKTVELIDRLCKK